MPGPWPALVGRVREMREGLIGDDRDCFARDPAAWRVGECCEAHRREVERYTVFAAGARLWDDIAHARWCALTGRRPDPSSLDAAVQVLLWAARNGINPREPYAPQLLHSATIARRLRRGLHVNGLMLGEGGRVGQRAGALTSHHRVACGGALSLSQEDRGRR